METELGQPCGPPTIQKLHTPYLLGDTCKFSRADLRGLVGFLTGHYPVRYHLNKMTLSD